MLGVVGAVLFLTSDIQAAEITTVAGTNSDACGAKWVCPSTKRELCGSDDNTYLNLCVMKCVGGEDVEIKSTSACPADILERNKECKTKDDQRVACESTDGCVFSPELGNVGGGGFLDGDRNNILECWQVAREIEETDIAYKNRCINFGRSLPSDPQVCEPRETNGFLTCEEFGCSGDVSQEECESGERGDCVYNTFSYCSGDAVECASLTEAQCTNDCEWVVDGFCSNQALGGDSGTGSGSGSSSRLNLADSCFGFFPESGTFTNAQGQTLKQYCESVTDLAGNRLCEYESLQGMSGSMGSGNGFVGFGTCTTKSKCHGPTTSAECNAIEGCTATGEGDEYRGCFPTIVDFNDEVVCSTITSESNCNNAKDNKNNAVCKYQTLTSTECCDQDGNNCFPLLDECEASQVETEISRSTCIDLCSTLSGNECSNNPVCCGGDGGLGCYRKIADECEDFSDDLLSDDGFNMGCFSNNNKTSCINSNCSWSSEIFGVCEGSDNACISSTTEEACNAGSGCTWMETDSGFCTDKLVCLGLEQSVCELADECVYESGLCLSEEEFGGQSLNGTCTYSAFQEQDDPLFCHNYTSEADCGSVYDVTGTKKCDWYDTNGGLKQCYNTSGAFDNKCSTAFGEDECNQIAGCSYRYMSGYQPDFSCTTRQLTREESCDRFSYSSLCDEQPFCKYVEVFDVGGSGSDGGFLGSGNIDVKCGTATTLQECNAIKAPDGKQACTYTTITSSTCNLNGSYWNSPDGQDFSKPSPECSTKTNEQDCLAESEYCDFSEFSFGSCSVAAHPCTLLKTEEDCKADDACQYQPPNKGHCQENFTNFESTLECRCLSSIAGEHWDRDACLAKGCSYFEGTGEGNGNVCTKKQDNDLVDPSCDTDVGYGDDFVSDDITSTCFSKRTQETCSAATTGSGGKACDWVLPQAIQTCEGNDNCLLASFVMETGKLNVTDCLSRSGCSVQSESAGDGYCIEHNPCAGKLSSGDCNIIEGCRWEAGFCSVDLDDVAFCTDDSCCFSVFGDDIKNDCTSKKHADGSQACMYLEGTGVGTCLAIGDAYCDLMAVYDKQEETGSLKSACNSFENCTFSTGVGIEGTCAPFDKCANYSLGNCDNADGDCETGCKATANCSWVEDVETCVKSGSDDSVEEGNEECGFFFSEITCNSAKKAENDENPRCAWVENICIDYEKCRSNEAQADELSCIELGCVWEGGFCRTPIDNINGQGDYKCVPEDFITQAPEVTFTTATTTTTLVHGCCVILIAGKDPSCKYEDIAECAKAEADLIFVSGTSTAEFKENRQCDQVAECTITTVPPATTQPPTRAPIVDRVVIQLVGAYVLEDQSFDSERNLFEELVDLLKLSLTSFEYRTVRELSMSFKDGNIVIDMRKVPLKNQPLAANLESTVQNIDNNPPEIQTTLAVLNGDGIQGTTANTLIKEAVLCAPGDSCLVNPKPTKAPVITTVTPAPTAAPTAAATTVTEKPAVTFKNVEGVYLGQTQALYRDLLESIETANDPMYVSVTKQLEEKIPIQLEQLEESRDDALDNILAARDAGEDDSEFVQKRDDINKNIQLLNDILQLARGTTTKKPTTTTVTTTTEIGTLAPVDGIEIDGLTASFQLFKSAVRTGNTEKYDEKKSELETSIPAKKTELDNKLSEVNQRIADAEASGADTSELEAQKNNIIANMNTLDRMLAEVRATTTEASTRAGTTTEPEVASESSSKKIKQSDIIIVVVIMVALALIATVMIVIIKRKLDNAALEQSAHATYSNPVYAGPQNGMGGYGGHPANARGSVASVDGEGYLDVAESGGTVPANAPAKKGLVRQESLC